MPEVDMYEVFYTTIYPGASPEDVELKVTIPLEEAIEEVDDIKEMIQTLIIVLMIYAHSD